MLPCELISRLLTLYLILFTYATFSNRVREAQNWDVKQCHSWQNRQLVGEWRALAYRMRVIFPLYVGSNDRMVYLVVSQECQLEGRTTL